MNSGTNSPHSCNEVKCDPATARALERNSLMSLGHGVCLQVTRAISQLRRASGFERPKSWRVYARLHFSFGVNAAEDASTSAGGA